MQGRRVLFYDPNPKARRIAERAVAATGSELVVAGDCQELFDRGDIEDFDLHVWHFEPHHQDVDEWRQLLDRIEKAFPRTKTVLHISESVSSYVPLMISHPSIRHLIAKTDQPLDIEELMVTSEKLLRNDLFGMEKYLLWGCDPRVVEITDSRDKALYVREVSEFAVGLGLGDRIIEMLETVVDELVANAIFDAPLGSDGKPRYAHLDRRESVVLEESERATLRYASDGRYFAVSVSDPFGALTRDTVVGYLARCLKKGPEQILHESGGAGLGLFRVLNALSKFVVNIDPGRQTEAIGLVDLRVSMREMRSRPKSLHVFVAEEGENA